MTLKSAKAKSPYFLGLAAGGTEIQSDGHEVLVITPSSALGQESPGQERGDRVPLPVGEAMVSGVS